MNSAQKRVAFWGLVGVAILLHVGLCGYGRSYKRGEELIGGGWNRTRLSQKLGFSPSELRVSDAELDELWPANKGFPPEANLYHKFALYARYGDRILTFVFGIVMPVLIFLSLVFWRLGWQFSNKVKPQPSGENGEVSGWLAQSADEAEFRKWRAERDSKR